MRWISPCRASGSRRAAHRPSLSLRPWTPGRGSYGAVHKARILSSGDIVAVKIIPVAEQVLPVGLAASACGMWTCSSRGDVSCKLTSNAAGCLATCPPFAQEEIAAIQKEIAMLRECNHPNIVKYYVSSGAALWACILSRCEQPAGHVLAVTCR